MDARYSIPHLSNPLPHMPTRSIDTDFNNLYQLTDPRPKAHPNRCLIHCTSSHCIRILPRREPGPGRARLTTKPHFVAHTRVRG